VAIDGLFGGLGQIVEIPFVKDLSHTLCWPFEKDCIANFEPEFLHLSRHVFPTPVDGKDIDAIQPRESKTSEPTPDKT